MHSFSKSDVPKDWRALLGDYFDSPAWKQLELNLHSALNSALGMQHTPKAIPLIITHLTSSNFIMPASYFHDRFLIS